MKKTLSLFLFCFLFINNIAVAQQQDAVVEDIIHEARENSLLKQLAHELTDVIGPRLVGTPQMMKARKWAVEKFESWGIAAENQQWGQWRGWKRGITHIDLVAPRTRTLTGRILAWSPGTEEGGITADVITLPQNIADSVSFQQWLPNVKGKFVLISMYQPTGRPDANWEKWATDASFKQMKEHRQELRKARREKFRTIGYSQRSLAKALEKAGAAGVISSNWSGGFGVNKVFSSHTKEIPS